MIARHRTRRAAALSALWTTAALGAASCRGCYLPERDVAHRVRAVEVIGRWGLTPCSLELLRRDGFQAAPGQTFTMTLADGGRATYAAVDDVDLCSYVEMSGTWSLPNERDERRPNELELVLRRTDNSAPRRITWRFVEVDNRLRLWSFLGDPDSWKFVEYVRIERSPASPYAHRGVRTVG